MLYRHMETWAQRNERRTPKVVQASLPDARIRHERSTCAFEADAYPAHGADARGNTQRQRSPDLDRQGFAGLAVNRSGKRSM